MMGKVLLVVAPERFRDEELFVTREELERGGHSTVVASTRRGRCQGSRGGSVMADIELSAAKVGSYDAVVFVGGGGSKLLFEDADALRLAREARDGGKVLGAICLAPVILANAGVLAGKQATVAGTEAKTIEAKGARYTGPGVAVDGDVVTANAPKASGAFGQRIAEILNSRAGGPNKQGARRSRRVRARPRE